MTGEESTTGQDETEKETQLKISEELLPKETTNDTENIAAKETTSKKRGVFARIGARISKKVNDLKEAMKERGAELEHAKKKRIIAGISILLLVVFFVVFYIFVGLAIADFVKDPEGFKEWISGFDEGAIAIFVGLRVVMTVLRIIPGGPLQVAGGYAFGTWGGLLWCMVGSAIGTLIIFFLGRKYGTKLVGIFISPGKMQSGALFKDKRKRNTWLFLMNFLPGLPKDIFTWVAALADDGKTSSFFVILLARIPSVLASTWSGNELMQQNYLRSGIIFGALLVIGVVCSYAYKKISKKHESKKGEKEENKDE